MATAEKPVLTKYRDRMDKAVAALTEERSPELALARVGQSDPVYDRRIVKLMEAGDHEAMTALTAKELHESGSHELLNWLVLLGAVSQARATVRFFGEMGRVDLAALEWDVA